MGELSSYPARTPPNAAAFSFIPAQGTLGGLVVTAPKFAQILEGALERSRICSLCADHQQDNRSGDRVTHGSCEQQATSSFSLLLHRRNAGRSVGTFESGPISEAFSHYLTSRELIANLWCCFGAYSSCLFLFCSARFCQALFCRRSLKPPEYKAFLGAAGKD
jgi:hypothetical protein